MNAEGTHLEGDDGDGHHAEVDHAERVLPAQQARVEEADARNHDPHQRHAREDPRNVAAVVHKQGAVGRVDPVHVARRVVGDVERARGELVQQRAALRVVQF